MVSDFSHVSMIPWQVPYLLTCVSQLDISRVWDISVDHVGVLLGYSLYYLLLNLLVLEELLSVHLGKP